MTPSAKREILAVLVQDDGVPVRRACQAVRLSRAAYYRPPRFRLMRDADVVTALNDVVARHTRWGFWKCFHRLRRAGHRWNHKRVHRVYCALRLNLPRRTKWLVPTRVRQHLVAPARLNETWALDFMADALYDGRSFRTFNVLHAYLFDSFDQVREITDAWLETYNTERPHDGPGQLPPLVFRPRPTAPAESSFEVMRITDVESR